jgi:hypothetical protein
MNNTMKTKRTGCERGTALLISIFALLLISAVAISLIVMAGMESSIDANYKSATQVYYNARAGLEEGRGRLWSKNPNPLTAAGFPSNTSLLPLGQVWYITNPAASEVVDPKTAGSTYYDNEYLSEWGVPVTGATVKPYVSSVASLSGTPNAPYKWVRVTATTEKSANLDVNGDSVLDAVTPLVYDGSQMLLSTQPTANAIYPVYTVTALAVTPSGGQRTEEYLTAMTSLNLNFPSPLTLAGNNVTFQGANSAGYYVNGQDGSGNPPAVAGCNPNPLNTRPSISVTDISGNNQNKNAVVSGIPSNRTGNYTGGGLSTPSVSDNFSLTNALQSPAGLNQLIQTVSQSADLVINGNATQANMPAAMSASNPMTVVVNGDFSMTGNFTGYGLLIVTGNFSYSGTDGWKGIVLVVGDGTTTYIGNGGGNNEFDGAMFVATIKDANGNVLSNFGNVSYNINGGGGNGTYYNSCWVNSVQQSAGLKILSFREISN